ncbi:hypothetical protein FRC0436_00084 [Corynebacterium diphtheriae]|uniref:hypothetical protein n=1 Tax=Corynebacterium diphtheriae TaxID=1717 RepID=UPI0013CC5B2B|nr:hypothetical protein CIP100629_00242 [Corynebacterium diphtheriae]CAB0679034.1 hypothetical protein FRC0022_00374 [Corynebacterium diphtheriae]CAB0844087.1 hypothetical protein FRC0370_00180 [Corynebacterium diphtheriae]CAB0889405.1 hypothetical protein FRC0425_00269 [Corynebacterium diphtheriae]CAB0892766.1 hypothetical protein FRC0429_00422 [Corynebacterium diphtheriae]
MKLLLDQSLTHKTPDTLLESSGCAIKPQSTVELSQYPEDYLDAVAEELNDRLRKTLEYDKPSERILKLLA